MARLYNRRCNRLIAHTHPFYYYHPTLPALLFLGGIAEASNAFVWKLNSLILLNQRGEVLVLDEAEDGNES